MTPTPRRSFDRITKVVDAWSNLRPTKSFFGLTLDEFKAAIKPSLDARATIAQGLVQSKANFARSDEHQMVDGDLRAPSGRVRRKNAPGGRFPPQYHSIVPV